MTGTSLQSGFADPPLQAARTFRSAMEALARPGTLHQVPGPFPPAPLSQAAAALVLTLVDAETPLYLGGAADVPAVREWVAFHCGARCADAAEARFALGTWPALWPITQFAAGTPQYPDRSATLIVEMPELRQEGARLTGPGIEDETALNLPETIAFAENAARYPLGVDFYFCAGRTIAALPRSTQVEAG